MNKGLEALEKIKNIPLSHIEQSRVENYDDSYDYYYDEVDDGTVEDNYAEEIEIIEEALEDYEELTIEIKELMKIIENQGINGNLIKETNNVIEYNERIKSHYGMRPLSTEDYDSLKELF